MHILLGIMVDHQDLKNIHIATPRSSRFPQYITRVQVICTSLCLSSLSCVM